MEENKISKKSKAVQQNHKSAKKKKKQAEAEISEVSEVSTISIAVPGSILENAHSLELKTYLAGQIARAACIYNVDEIVIYDDSASTASSDGEDQTARKGCCSQMARILQYLECPQYLRKFFFPLHRDLKFCGLLNPLDAPHHLRQNNDFMFREGVVTEKPTKTGKGSNVNIGLRKDAYVEETLTPGIRVTVKLSDQKEGKKVRAAVVSPALPRQETGVYWGYSVRIAETISQVFSQSPYEDGYDLTIGTSDRGTKIQDVQELSFNHALVVFGGVMGIEYALENDNQLSTTAAELLFDHYINTAPKQGSRTIRTEEAVLISLAGLQDKLKARHEAKAFNLFSCIPQSQDTRQHQGRDH
ncbi:putative methyltransferase C9orf114 homolog [Phlebotomus argentipes]|uniref:putative methyltransferase C9orf114 homolog n=1 Tax=Phlebotomus argentipes TaxID=94469 RepID=UPI002892CAC4|nr:putative methyltransferase C9orf114 homolog [Phlebotomus argentipes]